MRVPAAVRRRAQAVRQQRHATERAYAPAFTRDLAAYFGRLRDRLTRRVRSLGLEEPETKAAKPPLDPDDLLDFGEEEADLLPVVRKHFGLIAAQVAEDVSSQLGVTLAFDLSSRGMVRVMDGIGPLVKGITDDTRSMLASMIETGIRNGDSPYDIAKTILGSASQWLEMSGSRAEVIARTETAHAYTWASIANYRDSGLVETVICLDSPDCGWDGHDDPEEADGTVRDLDEAEMFPTSHPNCVRAFAPNVDTGSGTIAEPDQVAIEA